MPMVQIRIVRMLMSNGVVNMKMGMPLMRLDYFTAMRVIMMSIGMMMVMNMLHCRMGMQVVMRKNICYNNRKRKKHN